MVMKDLGFIPYVSLNAIAKRCPPGYHITPDGCRQLINGKPTGQLYQEKKKEVHSFLNAEQEKRKQKPEGKKKDVAYESFIKVTPDHEAYGLVKGLRTGDSKEAVATREALMKWSDEHNGAIPFIEYEPFEINGHKFKSGITTYTMFTDDSGEYTPERQKIHEAIVLKIISGLPKAEGRKARIAFTGGGSASGKGSLNPQLAEYLGVDMTVKRKKGESDDEYKKRARSEREKRISRYKIDPDAIMEMIPEYKEYVKHDMIGGASVFHREASDIAKLAYNCAISGGLDFVYDGTFSQPKKSIDWVNAIDKNTYDCYLVGKLTDVEICKQRAKKRFIVGGYKGMFPRIVPTAILESSNKGFKNMLKDYDMDEVFGKGHWKTIEDDKNKK